MYGCFSYQKWLFIYDKFHKFQIMTIFMCKNHVSFLPLLTALHDPWIHSTFIYKKKTWFQFLSNIFNVNISEQDNNATNSKNQVSSLKTTRVPLLCLHSVYKGNFAPLPHVHGCYFNYILVLIMTSLCGK